MTNLIEHGTQPASASGTPVISNTCGASYPLEPPVATTGQELANETALRLEEETRKCSQHCMTANRPVVMTAGTGALVDSRGSASLPLRGRSLTWIHRIRLRERGSWGENYRNLISPTV